MTQPSSKATDGSAPRAGRFQHLWPEELPGESAMDYLDRVCKPGNLKAGQRIQAFQPMSPEEHYRLLHDGQDKEQLPKK